jgi:hypothetical protein
MGIHVVPLRLLNVGRARWVSRHFLYRGADTIWRQFNVMVGTINSFTSQMIIVWRNWADPPLSALGPKLVSNLVSKPAIFPVFPGSVDFLTLCRQ